jgi:hypothetical protein
MDDDDDLFLDCEDGKEVLTLRRVSVAPLPLAPLPPNVPHPRAGLPLETATFKWKGSVYNVVEPARVNLHQCLSNFDLKCYFMDTMAMAANPDEQAKLGHIRLYARQWITDLYTVDDKGIFAWEQLLGNLRSKHKDRRSGENVGDPSGVYIAVISDSVLFWSSSMAPPFTVTFGWKNIPVSTVACTLIWVK